MIWKLPPGASSSVSAARSARDQRSSGWIRTATDCRDPCREIRLARVVVGSERSGRNPAVKPQFRPGLRWVLDASGILLRAALHEVAPAEFISRAGASARRDGAQARAPTPGGSESRARADICPRTLHTSPRASPRDVIARISSSPRPARLYRRSHAGWNDICCQSNSMRMTRACRFVERLRIDESARDQASALGGSNMPLFCAGLPGRKLVRL